MTKRFVELMRTRYDARVRRISSFGFIAGFLACAASVLLWVGSFVLPKPAGHPGPGFNWLRIDEGDDYVILRQGRLEQWINTPWDGKWYKEGSLPPLWIPALLSLGIAVGFRILPRLVPAPVFTAFCPPCGFNLTGNTSGTFPACGTPVQRGPEAGP